MQRSFHIPSFAFGLLLIACAAAGRAVAQLPEPQQQTSPLLLAEQCFDDGNLRRAAELLEQLVHSNDRSRTASVESVAAVRLLAQVYHRSADYPRAVELALRHSRLITAPDAELLLLLAESYLALGQLDEAQESLSKFRAAQPPHAADPRLAIDAARIASAVERANRARSSVASADDTTLLPPDSLAIIPDQYRDAHRFQAVNLLVDSYLESRRITKAIQLLASELSSNAYDDVEQAELQIKLVDCYLEQAAGFDATAHGTTQNAAVTSAVQALHRLAAAFDLRRAAIATTSAGARADDLARLLVQEATVHERRAELSRFDSTEKSAAAEHWQHAAKSYRRLLELASQWDTPAARPSLPEFEQPRHALAPGRAAHYRDAARCGLQRAYDALRQSATGRARAQYVAALVAVSDELAAERASRLLPGDPALTRARMAQASVLASVDDPASHRRAADIYRSLTDVWQAGPQNDPLAHATALIGLAEMLRSLNQSRDAFAAARQARQLVEHAPVDLLDPQARRKKALLAARVDNSLAVTSISLGQYRDAMLYLSAADVHLKPYSSTGDSDRAFRELVQKNQDALHILSRVRVYRGLLHKAEAQYDDAANRVREGRELRERLDQDADLLAYHLAEAAVYLAQAKARLQDRPAAAEEPAVREALAAAAAALDRAQPLADARQQDDEPHSMEASLPYRYLRALLTRMSGQRDQSRQALAALAEESSRFGDGKIAAKCYMQLAQLAIESTPQEATGLTTGDTTNNDSSIAHLSELRKFKLDRRVQLLEAADYTARAVELFKNMDRAAVVDDDQLVTALPSLHFQAAFFAARMHVLLAEVDRQINQLDQLIAGNSAVRPPDRENSESISSHIVELASLSGPSDIDHRQMAIDFLEDAITQAERPASSTTHDRLLRARFFSRYAPAYDLLVDLHVAVAAGTADTIDVDSSSAAYASLRRAIEVADLARNRTFREQIDGWRDSAGSLRAATALHWNDEVAQLVAPDAMLLVYHLDGPQLLSAGNANQQPRQLVRIGGGHLFAVTEQGNRIRYFRLEHRAPGEDRPRDLTRQLTANLVRRHVAWIERPEAEADWGRLEQRALAEALLPRELLRSIAVKHLVIIPDGALHQLPFESLLLPRDAVESASIRYVLDELPPIRYGPSLSVLAAIRHTTGQGGPAVTQLLTVGDPAYPDRAHQTQLRAWQNLMRQVSGHENGFPLLTHSRAECESVFASFDGTPHDQRVKMLQSAATEAAVRKYIGSSRFIHLAAHGCVDYRNDNLLGALIFAPGDDSDDEQNDGLLHLRDIYGFDLTRCELAVLSACQTYVGPQRPLEAGTSMARAFIEQGAKRVVCSQWATDDQAATQLIQAFFDSVKESRQAGHTVDYALALHEAKRSLRRLPGRGSLPKYWAPFILVGAP